MGGDSRCVGVDSTSMLIERVGCDRVNIRCDATDRAFVFMTEQPRTPGLKSLAPAKECIEKQCGALFPAALSDAGEEWKRSDLSRGSRGSLQCCSRIRRRCIAAPHTPSAG